jgi:membrane-associated phospholipid phosphatase
LSTLERVWIAYLLTVMAVAVAAASPHDPSYAPGRFLLAQTPLLAAALALHLRGPKMADSTRRLCHYALVGIGLPVVFSSLGWILPAIHPEPFEWTWIEWDRGLFGGDPSQLAEALLSPVFTELLQWVYASFYFIPITAVVGAGMSSGRKALDRALTIVVFSFLVSYLGYLLWPTLPPYRFLHYDQPLGGLWLTASLHGIIDDLEFNHWDCFPSGHTMLSLVSLIVCWRYSRRLLPILIPVVALMILSTVALRYHYVMDVLAGTVLAWPAVWLCDWLQALDAEAERKPSAGAAP